MLPPLPSWNNLANLYNSNRCTHATAKTRDMECIRMWCRMVPSPIYNPCTRSNATKIGYTSGTTLACIPIKNLRYLKASDTEVISVLLETDPPLQLKELWLTLAFLHELEELFWSYLTKVTSLTHLSLTLPRPSNAPPPLIFLFQELQHLCIHVAFAPCFSDQPMKKMTIETESKSGQVMVEVRQHWEGIVFPHVTVECLDTDRPHAELDEIPIEFWKEFLSNVKEVT